MTRQQDLDIVSQLLAVSQADQDKVTQSGITKENLGKALRDRLRDPNFRKAILGDMEEGELPAALQNTSWNPYPR